MKLITAVIKPFKVDEVRQAVADIGIQGVTVTEVHGYGRQLGHTEIYRGAEYRVDFLPKAKIELAVDDSIAEQVMEAVCNVARTGKTGDGKVWVLELEQALRVRTGETGPDASKIRYLNRTGKMSFEGRADFLRVTPFVQASLHASEAHSDVLGASHAGKPANSP